LVGKTNLQVAHGVRASRARAPGDGCKRGSAGAEALRPIFFGQPFGARARQLQAEGADTYASGPLVPPGHSSAGLTSFGDLWRLRSNSQSSAVRDGLPCVSLPKAHSLAPPGSGSEESILATDVRTEHDGLTWAPLPAPRQTLKLGASLVGRVAGTIRAVECAGTSSARGAL